MKLTDAAIRKLQPQSGQTRTVYSDDDLPGFRVKVSASSKTFTCDFRLGGKRITKTLGKFPAVMTSTARGQAKRYLDAATTRAVDLDDERAVMLTVGGALDMWEAAMRADGMKTVDEVARLLRHRLADHMDRAVMDVTPVDLTAIMDAAKSEKSVKTGKRLSPARINRIGHNIQGFFGWLTKTKRNGVSLLDVNPADGFFNVTRERPRDRLLTLGEVRAIYDAMGDLPEGAAARLLLLSACRVSEIAELRVSEVDTADRVLRISGDRTKTGKPHLVPLCDAAWDIVAAALRVSDGGGYVFRSRTLNRTGQKLNAALQLDTGEFRLHDLRTAFSTIMAERDAADPVSVELCLGHTIGRATGARVAGSYNFASFLTQRRAALQAWGDLVTRSS